MVYLYVLSLYSIGLPSSSSSNCMALPLSQLVNPLTFSNTNPTGSVSLTTRTYSNNSFPLSSSRPFLRPARLKLWQGGPPITNAASPTFNPAVSNISFPETSIILLLITGVSGAFALNVSQHDGSISTATAISKPARRNPISIPPAPENRLMTFNPFISLV